MKSSTAEAFADGDAKRLARELTGAALPRTGVESVDGQHVALCDLSVGWLVVYCFPGGHVASDESHREDERDRRAYSRYRGLFERREVRVASLSSEPRALQQHAMLAHRLSHHVLLDRELLIADALGLPTLGDGQLRAYSRLALVARSGVIEHVFYPLRRGGRSVEQAIAWMDLHADRESPLAG